MPPTQNGTLVDVRRADVSPTALAALLAASGIVHLLKPAVFAMAIPPELPGTARSWIVGSGVAELAVAAALVAPRTRRLGAGAAVGLLVAVFPGNVQMLRDARGRGSAARRVVLWLRLPLQVPLVAWAWRARRLLGYGPVT